MPEANPATPKGKKLHVIHGPVAVVRAFPSREVSVISVEIPEEFHVQATNLLYGRDAIVTRSRLPSNTRYGVLDPLDDELTGPGAAASTGPGSTAASAAVVHGHVCGVRAVPSRQVTVVAIEVPEEAHVEVTQLLYGVNALVVPAALPKVTPYGVIRPVEPTPPAATTRAAAAPAQRPGARGATGGRLSPSMFTLPAQVNVVRWLGIRCTEDDFQAFLGVRNEAQAAARVRELCGVESRKDIAATPRARDIFMTQIFEPFNRVCHHAPSNAGVVERPRGGA
jgi:hypothetical protein